MLNLFKRKKVTFSRLLKIFKKNDLPAFIVELNVGDKKELFVSFFQNYYDMVFNYYDVEHKFCSFEEVKDTELAVKFKNLSNKCLLNICKDARYMLADSPITDFDSDLSGVENASRMFFGSKLKNFNSDIENIKITECMFSLTKFEKSKSKQKEKV